MKANNDSFILIAEDDADDRMLILEAFEENQVKWTLQFVEDGAELLDFLQKKGKYQGNTSDTPELILLDINMPRKDGKQALEEIKNCPAMKHIPVIIFTTSNRPDDIEQTYKLGANSFIIKPSSYTGFMEIFKILNEYWVNTVSIKAVVKN